MHKTDVLIIGAGPTGLVLALWLTKIGVKVRIIDKTDRPGTTSRAIGFHARSLEFYHQLGISDNAIKNGVEVTSVNLWVKAKKVGHMAFSDLNVNISPYQYMLIYTQDQQEEMLVEELAKLGIYVERNTELHSFEFRINSIHAHLDKTNGEKEICEAKYLAGCDGAHSTVRQIIGATFPGGTYEETYYVADLKIKGIVANGELSVALDRADFLAIFPMNGEGRVRLVGTIKLGDTNKQLGWNDVSEDIIKRLKIEVEEVHWFSTYRVHHRVASHFRKRNVFLLGDAGHIHSPVGAQGMNTGIGDAVNLAWKIGAVINDKAPASILDTYEQERIPFAKLLVSTTDRVFAFVNAHGFFAAQIRIHLMPRLVSLLSGFVSIRRLMFRLISQTRIKYPQSFLSSGAAGKVKDGARLPWVKTGNGLDNFESLTSMKWQVHIYGDNSVNLEKLCLARNIKLTVYAWNAEAHKAGLKKNAAYVVRPDGYVGLAEPNADLSKITVYFDKWNIL